MGQSNDHSLWGEDAKKDIVADRAEQLAIKPQVAVVVASYQGWRSDLPPSQNHCWEAGDTPQESP